MRPLARRRDGQDSPPAARNLWQGLRQGRVIAIAVSAIAVRLQEKAAATPGLRVSVRRITRARQVQRAPQGLPWLETKAAAPKGAAV